MAVISRRRTCAAPLIVALASLSCGRSESGDGLQQSAIEDVVPTGPTDPFAGLGRGRDLVTQELRDYCIGSTTSLDDYAHAYSHLYLDAAMTKEQIKDNLDVSAHVSGSFWKVNLADAGFEFHRSAVENEWSIVLAYGADYLIRGHTLDPNTRKMLVDPATTPSWYTRCGDHFLMQTDQGGKLFVTARIEFDSLETKTQFVSKLDGKFGWATVKAAFERNRTEFNGKALIHVDAFQEGGNVAAIGEILGGANFVECGIGDMGKCDTVITKVLAYAGSADFVTGMNTKPADVRYWWNSWRTVVSTGLPPERSVPPEILGPRDDLKEMITTQLQIADRIAALDRGMTTAQLQATKKFKADFPGFKAAVTKNAELLRNAAKACFDDLDDPANATLVQACVAGASPATLAGKGYDASVTMERLDPTNGTVMGRIDGIVKRDGGHYLGGWACVRGDPNPVDVQLLVSSTGGLFPLASAVANLPSEPEVAEACNASGTTYRFEFPLDGYVLDWSGEKLTVKASSPYGDPTVALQGSGSFAVPTGWRYDAGYDSWSAQQKIFNLHWDQHGYGIFDGDNSPTMRYPDVNGDGKADACIRMDSGVECQLSTGTGWTYSREFDSFATGQKIFVNYVDQRGYGAFDGDNVESIAFPDVSGDGKADACLRHDYGLECWISTGSGWSNPVGYDSWRTGQLIFQRFSNQHGYGAFDGDNSATVRFPDLNGDGKADACVRQDYGLQCWLSTGTGWTNPAGYDSWTSGQRLFANNTDQRGRGAFDADNWSTIRYPDLNGDGKADACIRYDFGLQCWLSTGAGWQYEPGYDSGLFANGWNQRGYGNFDGDNVPTIRYPDVNGDGKADACIRNDSGLECFLSTGTAWTYAPGYNTFATGQLIFYRYWDQHGYGVFDGDNALDLWYPDLDGDGKADACLRNDWGLQCFRSTGTGWVPWNVFDTWLTGQLIFNRFSDQHYIGAFDGDNVNSVALPDVNGDSRPDACVRHDSGLQCWVQ